MLIGNRKLGAVVALLAAMGLWSGCTAKKMEPMTTAEVADGAMDPAEWGKVYPIQYKLWQQTGEPTPAGKSKYKRGFDVGEDRPDKLDEYPFLALLYNGWGFGSEYKEPRGHFFMVQDQLEVDPGRIKAGGSCLTCKTPYAPMLQRQMGSAYFSTPYKEVLARLPKDQQSLGVACVDCHDNRTMQLKISRGFTLGKALKDMGGVDVTQHMSTQHGRNLVCAQCHVTYIIPKDKEMHSTDVFFPWQGSEVGNINVENIIKVIKSSPANGEWKQTVTGFKLGFIRHPEYELFSNNSPHWAAGVTCADCHMPKVTVVGQTVSDHRIMSPLKSDLKACAACHSEAPGVLRSKVLAIQDDTMVRYLSTGYATATDAKLFEMANKVEASGKEIDKELYAKARENYEQAFYRVVFIGAENSIGFHNPKETTRVLMDAAKYAAAADGELRQLLAQAGQNVPEVIDLELSKYTNYRGSKKLMFKPEREIKSPTGK